MVLLTTIIAINQEICSKIPKRMKETKPDQLEEIKTGMELQIILGF